MAPTFRFNSSPDINDYSHAAVEVHAVDTDTRVVLDAQVDVLGDTETEVAGLREVALAELVLLDLEATLEDFLSLGTTDGNVDSDLFVAADTEGTDGVAGLAYVCEKIPVRQCSIPNAKMIRNSFLLQHSGYLGGD